MRARADGARRRPTEAAGGLAARCPPCPGRSEWPRLIVRCAVVIDYVTIDYAQYLLYYYVPKVSYHVTNLMNRTSFITRSKLLCTNEQYQ